MRRNQKSCMQEETSILAAGRELMEEELATIYGGQGTTGSQGTASSKNSSTLGNLGGLLSGGMLGDLANSSNGNSLSGNNSLSPVTDSLKNAVPGLGGLSNLSQLLAGLGL